MVGYIFETTNTKTGETYLDKRYAVTFDKNFLGEGDDVAKAIEKYGRPTFVAKMLMPFEDIAKLDEAFAEMKKSSKPAKKEKVVEEEPKAAKKKKSEEE